MGMGLELSSLDSYKKSVIEVLESELKAFFGDLKRISADDVRKNVVEINKYPRISSLRNPRHGEIAVVEEYHAQKAEKAVLAGKFFCEHTAAGEATRLGLGTKYLLDLSKFSVNGIRELMLEEYLEDEMKRGVQREEAERIGAENFSAERLLEMMQGKPSDIAPLSLGTRHMMQMNYDVTRLAKKHGKSESEVLSRQSMLVVLNEETADTILKEFEKYNYFGFRPKNVYFMIQSGFYGIGIENGKLFFDENSAKRLHNHGQMMMQKCHDKSIFCVEKGEKEFLSYAQYSKMLTGMEDLLSYNIEDIGYLTDSIDFASLGFALELGAQGYEMVMEVVAQNQYKPQKGGACLYDEVLKRIVMVETNRLGDIDYKKISHLNKNFNHYPHPDKSLEALKREGIDMPFDVKESKDQDGNAKLYIYPCPIQGDLNFKVKSAYVMRSKLKPISNLKSPATMPPTVCAMRLQDEQEGFLELSDQVREGV
jgi:hypothetical protein